MLSKMLSRNSLKLFTNPKICCSLLPRTSADSRNVSKQPPSLPLMVSLVQKAPEATQPYLKLMRIERPIGTWLLYWPCGWGIATATVAGGLPDLYMLATFAVGAVILRGANCTLNDMCDVDIDKKVSRTKERPLANDDISMKQAAVFLGVQLSVGLAMLYQLDWYSIYLGLSALPLIAIYPLLKRVTYWPQFVLGLHFNWGILLGYSAIKGCIDLPVCLPLYIAGVCWTIVYDTIYAHQDRLEDIKLGLKSTAIKFNENTKLWLSGFGTTMVGNLILSGIMAEQTWPYYIGVALAGGHIGKQIFTFKINDGKDCAEKFKSNFTVGLIIFSGIVLGTLLKHKKNENELQT